VFHAIAVAANILGAINPLFFTVALLDIVSELSFILAAVDVSVLSVSVSHIVFELSSVDVTLSVPEGALTFSLVIRPVSFIMSTVDPVLYSIPMSKELVMLLADGRRSSVAIPGEISGALTEFSLTSFIFLFHLTPVTRVVWVDVHIPVYKCFVV
jgi:hypothetical protein